MMRLLKHGTDIDHGVDVVTLWRVSDDRRMVRLGKKAAQTTDRRIGACRVLVTGEDKYPEASIGLDDVAEMLGLGVAKPDDRRGVKTGADHETLRQMLMLRIACDDRDRSHR